MPAATSEFGLTERGRDYADFEWQGGYADFSVSQSNLEPVKQYIAGQEEHHRKVGFQGELRALLRKHEIEWDEKYVWEIRLGLNRRRGGICRNRVAVEFTFESLLVPRNLGLEVTIPLGLSAPGRFQIAERAARPLVEDFQLPGMAAVDALEVPRARDDFRAASTLTRPCALGVLSRGHVEAHQPPLTVPRPRPAFLRVAPAQDVQPPLRGQPIEPVIRGTGIALQELLLFQGGDLAHEAVALGPAFVRVGQVAEGGARQQVGGPEQEVQEFNASRSSCL